MMMNKVASFQRGRRSSCARTTPPVLVLGVFLMQALLWVSCVSAQDNRGLLTGSAELDEIRQFQRRIADRDGIEIVGSDTGQRSISAIRGVPTILRNAKLFESQDVIDVIETLYEYFGFRGTEELVYESSNSFAGETNYAFRQLINGIEAPAVVSLWVDDMTGALVRIQGAPYIDTGLSTLPNIDAQEAANLVLQTIAADSRFNFSAKSGGATISDVVYYPSGTDGELQPHWRIGLEQDSSATDSPVFEFFLVGPDGKVQLAGTANYISAARAVKAPDLLEYS